MNRQQKIEFLKEIQAGKNPEAVEKLVLITSIEKMISPKELPKGVVKTIDDARQLKRMLSMPFRINYADGRKPKLIESVLLTK